MAIVAVGDFRIGNLSLVDDVAKLVMLSFLAVLPQIYVYVSIFRSLSLLSFIWERDFVRIHINSGSWGSLLMSSEHSFRIALCLMFLVDHPL